MGNSESAPSTPTRKDKERESGQNRSGSSETQNVIIGNKNSRQTSTPPLKLASSASTSTSNEHAQATHSRSRSRTTQSAPIAMGNADSKPRPSSRASTIHTPPPGDTRHRSPLSQAVDVPQQPPSRDRNDGFRGRLGSVPIASSSFVYPPRLPLPIERDPEASSPILGPADGQAPPLGNDIAENAENELPSRPSLLSQDTLHSQDTLQSQSDLLSQATLDDDDDGADIQQYVMETNDSAPKIPTVMTWRGDANAVYVTGTFANWEKKFRLHKSSTGHFTTTMPLPPGTHHITFLVDGEPRTSRDLPTTVDFANALVNYIEVSAPQSPTVEKQPSEAVQIPGATVPSSRVGTDGQAPPLLDDQPLSGPPHANPAVPIPTSTHPSLRPHSIPTQPPPLHSATPPPHQAQQQHPQAKPQQKPRIPLPRQKYTSDISEMLLHLDVGERKDERFIRATKAARILPKPPTLPMFLGKSILNTTTPKNDDASVLTMPNHTVLNHLATSSIRSGVLATSGTTRYKRKFLTTIMFKPVSDDG